MSQKPSVQEQAAFFDDWNEKHRSVSFDEIEPESRARGERVVEVLSSLSINRPLILEVGCGTGWLTERLSRFGPTTAIDLSSNAIEIAKRRGLDAEFIASNIYEHDLPRSHFDVAVCLETISHVPDQPLFMEKLATAIKPRGYLILTTQNKFVYERRSDIGAPQRGNIRNWLTRNELKKLLKPAFDVLRTTTVLPKGDMGILRIVHSSKVNRCLGHVFSKDTIIRVQERLGFGHTFVILARRRSR